MIYNVCDVSFLQFGLLCSASLITCRFRHVSVPLQHTMKNYIVVTFSEIISTELIGDLIDARYTPTAMRCFAYICTFPQHFSHSFSPLSRDFSQHYFSLHAFSLYMRNGYICMRTFPKSFTTVFPYCASVIQRRPLPTKPCYCRPQMLCTYSVRYCR